MSDDEQYAGSPYDDFEEMLWDADPGPDLADDLAQHFAHSPVWQDDPVGELEPYHSDWEYYSDDYYDDDPAILRNNPIDGSPLSTKISGGTQMQKRGRKRKYDETRQTLEIQEKHFLINSIQGTVWAASKSPSTKVFRKGQEEKVALLVDWKERFKLDNGTLRTFGQGQLTRDESWANDLSLADMGLTHAREPAGTQNDVPHEDDGMEDDEDDDYEGEEDENENDFDEKELPTLGQFELDKLHDTSLSQEQRQLGFGPNSIFTANGRVYTGEDIEEPDETGLAKSRKRRKVIDLPVPPHAREPRTTAAEKGVSHSAETTMETNGMATKENQETAMRQRDFRGQDQSLELKSHESPQTLKSRKRKLSVESRESPDAEDSSASRRAKRSASTCFRSG